jgi:methylmalonyl-CoA/ethylmalonyl-CoA epimerase
MIMSSNWRVDHIGIAVTDLNQALSLYETMANTAVTLREVIPEQGVEIAFLDTQGSKIELLASTGPQSKLAAFLAKRGPGLHHICYEVTDIKSELQRLAREGFTLLDSTPRKGAGESKIAFIHPQSVHGVLTELCEYPRA